MHECPECGSRYTSCLAAEECADFERTEQQRMDQWTKQHPPRAVNR